ncbi:MAG TPA: helix-turn-helix domain-containing protein [Lachnospiraceae bacterium]|nr:helix-turn-helix domain-containing protein [Lachnospiraceae bacterium]
MNIKDIYGNNCPTLFVLTLLGGKWRLPILWKLSEHEVLRYNELKREVKGITSMVLTQCLQELESVHIINRKQYEEIPPRVEYSLTEEGEQLVANLNSIRDWGSEMFNKYPDILESIM